MTDITLNIVLALINAVAYTIIIRSLLGTKISIRSYQTFAMVFIWTVAIYGIFAMPLIAKMILLNVLIILTTMILLHEGLGISIAAGVMAYYIILFFDFMVGILLVSIQGYAYESISDVRLYWIISNLMVAVGSALTVQIPFIKGIFSSSSLLPRNRRFVGGVSAASFVLFAIQLYYFSLLPPEYFGQLFKASFLIQGVILIGFILVILINNRYWITEKKFMETNQALQKTRQHVETVEALVVKNRKYRHDLKNTLIGLNGLISETDQEAKQYLVDMLDEIDTDKAGPDSVDAGIIQNKVLLELIKKKQAYASRLGIDFQLAVVRELGDLPVNMIDFSKILGSLLDNAVEASVPDEAPVIFAYMEDSEEHVIAIINGIKDSDISVDRIFTEGYSTKGEGRGLGLNTVKELVDRHPLLALTTVIEDGQFIQEIVIKKKQAG